MGKEKREANAEAEAKDETAAVEAAYMVDDPVDLTEINVESAANAMQVILNYFKALRRGKEVLDVLLVAKQLTTELKRQAEALTVEIGISEAAKASAEEAARQAIEKSEADILRIRADYASAIASAKEHYDAEILRMESDKKKLSIEIEGLLVREDAARKRITAEMQAKQMELERIQTEIDALKARFQ